MVATIVTVCLLALMWVAHVLLMERADKRHTFALRELQIERLKERRETEERYLAIIREQSRLLRSENTLQAVQADNLEKSAEYEREVLEHWKKKQQEQAPQEVLPHEITTSDGRTLSLVRDF